MKTRSIVILVLIVAVTSVTAITAIAGSLRGRDEPIVETWSDSGTLDQPMLFECQVWADGSAEFKVTPKIELPNDELPSHGLITVNENTYRMAQARDRDGNTYLFGSVPVGTFSLDKDILYTLKAYDLNGVLLVDDYASQDVP